MKKVLFFFAVMALLCSMTACGGSVSVDGVTSKNEIKEGDSESMKYAKLLDQQVKIMEQEPSAEGYEAFCKVQMTIFQLDASAISNDEMEKAIKEFDPEYLDQDKMSERMKPANEKWQKWTEEHQSEIEEIQKKIMEQMMPAMPDDEPEIMEMNDSVVEAD